MIKQLKDLPMQPGGFLLALLLSWDAHLCMKALNFMDGSFNFTPFLIFVFKINQK